MIAIHNYNLSCPFAPNSLKKTLKRGKCGSRIKAGFLYISPNFSTQMNVSSYNAKPTEPNTLGTS